MQIFNPTESTWSLSRSKGFPDLPGRGRGIGGLRGGFQQPQQSSMGGVTLQERSENEAFAPGGKWFGTGGPGLTPHQQPQQMMVDPRAQYHQQREQQRLRQQPMQQMQRPSPYGGGPGFAKPLSPPPSAGGGGQGGGGGAPTSWKMSIEPMASGGIIGLAGGGYMPMYGMAGGGYVPMVYADGGYIPAYGLGGFLKKLGKTVLKLAPKAVSFIPGIGPLASGAIGGVSGALSHKLEGGDWGSSLSKGIMTGMGSYAGKKAFMGAKKGWGDTEGGWQDKLEGALGGLKDNFSYEDVLKLAPMVKAAESMGAGQSGGAGGGGGGGGGRISTVAAGGGGGRPAGGGNITDVDAPASQVYNLFGHLPGRATGGYVDNLYASRRFGGGPIPEYGIGGWLNKRRAKGSYDRRAAPAIPREDFDEFNEDEMYAPPPPRRRRPQPRPQPLLPPPPPVRPLPPPSVGEDEDGDEAYFPAPPAPRFIPPPVARPTVQPPMAVPSFAPPP